MGSQWSDIIMKLNVSGQLLPTELPMYSPWADIIMSLHKQWAAPVHWAAHGFSGQPTFHFRMGFAQFSSTCLRGPIEIIECHLRSYRQWKFQYTNIVLFLIYLMWYFLYFNEDPYCKQYLLFYEYHKKKIYFSYITKLYFHFTDISFPSSNYLSSPVNFTILLTICEILILLWMF